MGIPISKKRVRKCISSQQGEFTSADVLREYLGHFHRDRCPPAISFNALFGKWLVNNQKDLGIKFVRTNHSVIDDSGGKTRAATWKKVRK